MILEIADLRVNVCNRYAYTDKFCAQYLSPDQLSPCDITVEVGEQELAQEHAKTPNYALGYVENLMLYRKICYAMTKFDRFLFHGTVLEYEGNAYIFSGRSGSGKSTHTSLWLKYIAGAKILNGDKPILRMTENGITAYGTPWNGKEGLGYPGRAPVRAVCFIQQAKQNAIELVPDDQKAQRLFWQILVPNDPVGVEKTLAFADALTKLPIYTLYCDISEQAVKTSFAQLIQKPYKAKGEE